MTGPDLAALREMLAAYDDAEEWKVPGIVRETLDVLSLVDDLRAENERLRLTLENIQYGIAEHDVGALGDEAAVVLLTISGLVDAALAGSPAADGEVTDA